MKTAALDGALLVFHSGSGNTVALTDDVLAVFSALQRGDPPTPPVLSATDTPADAQTPDPDTIISNSDEHPLESCLRLLRQQQLITASEP